MNEPCSPALPPMSPRLARILPLAMTAIIPISALAVRRAYGYGPGDTAVAALIYTGCMTAGWSALPPFGLPVRGNETLWMWPTPLMLGDSARSCGIPAESPLAPSFCPSH